ncbi:MAG TPA: MFS transporter [Ignavibacteriaceae bacterium]|nr:MFS transporter [Ignavibacteriaceae bacterium]
MRRNYYMVFLVMLTFFVISFLTNIIGPLIPDIIKSFDLSLVMVAMLPFAFFIAYGFMSIPSGILLEKYKEKVMMASAFIIAASGALLFALFPNYLIAIISLFLIGAGMAILQVVINPLLRVSGGEEHFAFNAVFAQLIFGAASFLSPQIYSYLVRNINTPAARDNIILQLLSSIVPSKIPWLSLYWIFAAVSLVMIVIILLSKYPKVHLKEDEKAGTAHMYRTLLKNPIVSLFFIAIFAYVGFEQGTANWISQFLKSYYGYDPQTTGADTVSLFWGAMTLGCVLGLVLLKFIDSRTVLKFFTAGAIISLSAALFGGGSIALAAFPIMGFCASVMWSIIFSLALNSVDKFHGSFSGILITGIIGGAFMPLLIGYLSDQAGLRTGMSLLYLNLIYILLIGFWSKPLITNKTIVLKPKTAEVQGTTK